ncbi:MAG: hypothetical protein U0T74_07265 [Chitinophagales bacterium]
MKTALEASAVKSERLSLLSDTKATGSADPGGHSDASKSDSGASNKCTDASTKFTDALTKCTYAPYKWQNE